MEVNIEKMMEQLNSGESKTIFKNISCIVIIGLTTSGRKPWQEEEGTRKDTSTVEEVRKDTSIRRDSARTIWPIVWVCKFVDENTIPSTDDPAQEEDLLQKYQQRVERLPQQNRVIKICTDAWFLTTVDVGQYFMTKDTEEFSQFTEPVACREYTLPSDEDTSEPKGWIRGNTKIGFVLEVTTSYLQRKQTILIRGSEFLTAWISSSWTSTTTRRTTTTSRKPLSCSSKNLRWKRVYLLLRVDQRPKQNHEDVLLPAHLQELYPSGKESGLILSQ